ncbi:MAG: LPS export ABC transporter periplasmic protein LptC [Deltaproteobacteria bacterium]|nr:MAG: LPS export ABC transporter periplasmic protein LptC [Deltaproteobacteria bacterium]
MKESVFKQKRMLKLWRLALGIITLLLVSVLAYGWWDSSHWNTPVKDTKIKLDAEMVIKGVNYTEVRKGEKFWELRAKQARFYSDKKQTLLIDVEAVIYLKDGRQVYIEGDRAIMHVKTKNIDIFGKVTLSTGPYKLVTDSLHYNNNKRVIKTRDRVIMTGNGIVLKGHGLSLDINTKKMKIESTVDCLLGGKVLAGLG